VRSYELRLALRQPGRIPAALAHRAVRLRRRAVLRALRATGRPARIELPEGIRLVLPSDDGLAAQLWTRSFESAERELVRLLLRPGDVFYDVGAHVGLYTVLAATRVAPSGRVYAFEPNPAIFPVLERNVVANGVAGVVEAAAVALGEQPASLSLHVPAAAHSAWASLGTPIVGSERTVRVEVSTLDAVAARTQPPFAVKLDVEGWETQVLRGGAEMLASPDAPHLLVEFTDRIAVAAGSSTRELYDALRELGYELFRYRAGARTLEPEPFGGSYPWDNLVATKRPDEIRTRLKPRT
jgi:FkbM family methyltransferase